MQRSVRSQRTRRGFTLLEILIVLAIIGVIAAMAVPRLLGQQRTAQVKITKTAIMKLEEAADLYSVDNSGIPPESLQMLLEKSPNGTEALLDKIPPDAWGTALNYEYPNTKSNSSRPAIWSSGANRQNENGGGDDINNWSELVAK
ncbi:type II secretion system protein GspG [Planctomicrobium sp. SH668]|uniref:type II secretion system protein GspG n=1 Tax=Planctomicrobium sp. SH668 TaxID=3448126 RepID=UPI003F5B4675